MNLVNNLGFLDKGFFLKHFYSGGLPSYPSQREVWNNQQTEEPRLSPAALMYLFPEYFSSKARFGGFRSPCSDIKVKHNELFDSMFIGTLASMESRGLIRFYTYKKGFLIKSTKLGIVKSQNFNLSDYGYLGRRIARLPVGGTISVYGTLIENIETYAPDKHFISQVFRYDLSGRGLFWNDDPRKPICERIFTYREQVSRLSEIVRSFSYYRQNEYKMIKKEISNVFDAMKPEEEEDDWD